MKRIISLILAVSLLLAFIPANVSAAEGEVFTIDFGTYDKSTAFDNGGRYYMKSTTKGENWTLDVANTTCKTYYAGTASAPRLQANVTIARRDRTDGVSGNGSLAIKFTAPASGVYDVSVDVYEYSSAGYGDVHLIDGTNRIYLGSFASHRASTPYAEVNKKMLSVTLEGNKEYSLAFTPTEKIGDSGSNIYIYKTNFTPTDSSASVILTATADKTALVVGDTAKATASAALSNGGMYKLGTAGGEVTYESLNENVATVTADGDITAVADGTATIKAKTTINGTEYTDTFDVEVGYSFSVDFSEVDRDTQVFPSNTTSDQSFSNKDTRGENWTIDTTNSAEKHYDGTTSSVRIQSSYAYIKKHGPFAVNFTVEKGGKYNIDATVYKYTSCGNADFYIDGAYIGTINMSGTELAPKDAELLGAELSAGTHSLVVVPVDGYAFVQKLDFSAVKTPSTANISATVDSSVMNPGETQNINVAITAPENTVFDDTKAFTTVTNKVVVSNGNAITYTGYDSEIISVSDTGLITALAKGNTEVTVSAILGGLEKTAKVSVSVEKKAPGEVIEDTTVKFGAFADEGGTVTDENEVKNVEIGESVTVEATPDEGYEFAYWRNASGKHLSSSAKETFIVNTNTSVIAVFDKVEVSEEDTTVPVYLYNENGAFIEKRDAEKGSKFSDAVGEFKPTLTGFNFDKWSISGDTVVNSILRAVALYTADTTKYTVKVGENVVANGAYGDKVTVTGSDNFKAWKLEDNIVSYDKEYSFYIWGDITLTEVTEGETEVAPTVAINNIGDNYFIAYNVPAGYTLIEAGIVFADTGTPEVGSFYSKAVAKKGTGQFTAKKGDGKETAARGYVMFRDTDGSLRVIYSK